MKWREIRRKKQPWSSGNTSLIRETHTSETGKSQCQQEVSLGSAGGPATKAAWLAGSLGWAQEYREDLKSREKGQGQQVCPGP